MSGEFTFTTVPVESSGGSEYKQLPPTSYLVYFSGGVRLVAHNVIDIVKGLLVTDLTSLSSLLAKKGDNNE